MAFKIGETFENNGITFKVVCFKQPGYDYLDLKVLSITDDHWNRFMDLGKIYRFNKMFECDWGSMNWQLLPSDRKPPDKLQCMNEIKVVLDYFSDGIKPNKVITTEH